MTDLDVKSVLLEHYPFKEVLQLSLLKGGVSNNNYVFSNGSQKYVARVCLFEPDNQINSMIPFLKHAEATNYPAPRLVQANDGRDYLDNNDFPIVVTEYLEGDSADNISINIEHVKSLAQLVAGFHKIHWSPPNTPITLDPDYIFNLYDKIDGFSPNNTDKHLLRLIELVDEYHAKFKQAKFTELAAELPRGITHGDINLGNVLLHGDSAVSLLDFEELGVSWQLQDIAMILITWAYPDGKPNTDFIKAFIDEYELHRPMAQIEKENIVSAMEFIGFRQCLYVKSMISKGNNAIAVENFGSYWALRHLNEHSLDLSN
ncbi:MAG: Ser/Thr protein kinase RdoA (MazF antagonist) [Candidatus Saccharimonadales bacterium]|jgi:Ser/Thr protein kinase RdoA (MazF antagonist)